jgi:hypothetical protein
MGAFFCLGGGGGGRASFLPLYSRKLHIRVRLDNTSAVTSLTILALSLGLRVVNHFASRYHDQ